jgi:dipeptidase D
MQVDCIHGRSGAHKMKTRYIPYPIFTLLLVTALLIACAPAAQAPAANTTPTLQVPTATTTPPTYSSSAIPLKEDLPNLQPQDVFQNFYNITQVPRPSGHLDQIRAFLVNFGQGLGLETVVDDAGNVIIRKPASSGFENHRGVVLQAHMDMVPQKADDKDFDFTTDPIEAFVSGDYIITDGTTLGADDGIGMAIIMAVLQSKTIQAGPIEALFTVDEETDMSGANGLTADELQSRILINLDWETEGIFTIGSAGGEDVDINASYKEAPAPADKVSYDVKVKGLQGGHSGMDINLGRGHATKLLVRLLQGALEPYQLQVASLVGGTAANAIPTEADAVVFLPDSQVDAFTKYVSDFEATVKSELAATEPDLSTELSAVQAPAQVMDETFQNTLIDALYGTPQGVLRMSDTVPGLVETSTNLGITTAQDGKLTIVNFPRSSVDSELDDAANMIGSVWALAGYQDELANRFPAWTPNPDSPIVKLMTTSYENLYDQEPEITAIHAGLECGTIGGTYPDMDMISIGPTINGAHTPEENLYIPSVERLMNLLIDALKNIPEN